MSAKPDLVSEQHVDEFLAINREKYEALIASLYELFDRLFDTLDAEGRLYRIYSRSDKQRGRIFKDSWKIQYKVNIGRRKNNSLKIEGIGDIIGMTIVVPYPSDQNFVRKILDANIDRGVMLSFSRSKLNGEEIHGEPKTGDRGYHAHHYQLGLPRADLQGARCEVQIKTLLHDAWAAKTHDLTYKSVGEVDKRLLEQIETVGDDLRQIDRRSESLKELIEERINIERKRVDLAVEGMFRRGPNFNKRDYVRSYNKIRDAIENISDKLKKSDAESEVTNEIITMIDGLPKMQETYADNCRLFALLSSVTRNKNLFSISIDRINQWFTDSRAREGKFMALYAKSVAYYSFGKSVEASRIGERANAEFLQQLDWDQLDLNERKQWTGNSVLLTANLAYYYADIVPSDAGRKLGARVNSRKYINQAIRSASDLGIVVREDSVSLSADEALSKGEKGELLGRGLALLDTWGSVDMALASAIPDLDAGFKKCQRALALAKRSPYISKEKKEHQARYFEVHNLRYTLRKADLVRRA